MLLNYIAIITLLWCNCFAKETFQDIQLFRTDSFTVKLESAGSDVNGFNLVIEREGVEREILGHIGRTLKRDEIRSQTFSDGKAFLKFSEAGVMSLNAYAVNEGYKISVRWEAPKNIRLEDCFDAGSKHWYGGPEQQNQQWPIEKLHLKEYSYIAKELDNSAIMEPYFLNSDGQFIYIHKEVPLFVDINNIKPGHFCFIGKVAEPYSMRRSFNELAYDFFLGENAKTAHEYAVENYLGKPSGIPDTRMVRHPVWSTWARFMRPINQTLMLNFANEIIANGFNNSQIEIDDLWEICYGSLTIDEGKFPDMKTLVEDLKRLGYRVTMWVHPFINLGCDPWYTEALQKGYLVRDEKGSVFTTWWNSNGTKAAYIDFTNPEATEWWAERIRTLQKNYGFDSFKFDAGEISWAPQVSVLKDVDIHLHPSQIVQNFVRKCAEFGGMIEIRTGVRTQDLPVFVRMVDKDSYWTFQNGLPTLITTLLQMNMNGYPFVLADMIGGNGYYGVTVTKELFIRWLQANTFMPALQYSFAPFDYDEETLDIGHKFTNLHAEYSDEIIKAMQQAVSKGTPVNAPIWWVDPYDQVALGIWDEYLLGENILVAPVLEPGMVSRNIYLPAGIWYSENDRARAFTGPLWLLDYPAPLDTLPYFVKESVP